MNDTTLPAMVSMPTKIQDGIRNGAFEGLAAALREAAPDFRFLPASTNDDRGEIQHYISELDSGEVISLRVGRDPFIRSHFEVWSGKGNNQHCVCEIVYSAQFPVHGNPNGSWVVNSGAVEHTGVCNLMLGIVNFVTAHPKVDFFVRAAGDDNRLWALDSVDLHSAPKI